MWHRLRADRHCDRWRAARCCWPSGCGLSPRSPGATARGSCTRPGSRVAAGLIGARSLLHVHDLNDPGPALSVLQGVRAHPMDAAVGVSQAVHELTVSRYHVRPARVRIARNGIPPPRSAATRRRRCAQPRQHVRFLGRRADVPRLLPAIDLVLMPSRSEGLGLAAMEARAAASPVIAFAVGGLPEVVVDGLSGRLVPPGHCERRDRDAARSRPALLLRTRRRLECPALRDRGARRAPDRLLPNDARPLMAPTYRRAGRAGSSEAGMVN